MFFNSFKPFLSDRFQSSFGTCFKVLTCFTFLSTVGCSSIPTTSQNSGAEAAVSTASNNATNFDQVISSQQSSPYNLVVAHVGKALKHLEKQEYTNAKEQLTKAKAVDMSSAQEDSIKASALIGSLSSVIEQIASLKQDYAKVTKERNELNKAVDKLKRLALDK